MTYRPMRDAILARDHTTATSVGSDSPNAETFVLKGLFTSKLSRTMMPRLSSPTTPAEAAISSLEIESTDNGCPRAAEDETEALGPRVLPSF